MTQCKLTLTETGSNRYPDLETALHLAQADLALCIALTIRDLLASGLLVRANGCIMPLEQ